MLKLLTSLPIFRRLFIAFALAAILPGIVIGLLGSYFISTLDARGQAERTSFDAQSVAAQQQTNLQRMNESQQTRFDQIIANLSGKVNDSSLNASGALINSDIVSRELDFNQTLATYHSNYELATSSNMSLIRSILMSEDPNTGIISDQQLALNKVINGQWPDYQSKQDAVLNQLQQLDTIFLQNQANGTVLSTEQITQQYYTPVYRTLFSANNAFTDLKNSWQRVVDDAVVMGKGVTTVGTAETQPIIIFTIIALFCTVMVVVTTGYVVNITITRPLRQLASLTKRIAKGNTNARATVAGYDEISLVASSMNNMLDNIVRLIQEVQYQRDLLQAQVEKLVSEVSGVGEGDLRVQAEVTADALGVLADSFNYMVEELGSLVVRVKMVAQEVESSTATIFDRLTQLVETGDIQVNQINDAAIEVEHMAESSRRVAERARVLFNVASDARQSAQGGREAVQQAVEGMGRIHENVQTTAGKVQTLGDRSREINNIIEAISGIAHQTNRLALDAAIQAAMAGENGKGFGAVAADIRRLAERAKDQANMITKIVRSVREDIGAVAVSMQDTERETSAGSQLTQEAGIALESIFSAVEHQAIEIENINQVAIQQLQSSSAVEQIMRGVSATTQQSTLSTRDASQNMDRLARLVEQLRASVEAFKLRENQGYYTPNLNVNVAPVNEYDNQMTVSGVFRTVTSTAQPTGVGGQYALPAARSNDLFSFYPAAPLPQNGGWDGQMQPQQPQQPWYGEPYNEWASNGNRNR
jgi:methyl-accepting chemotaxis protein